MNKYEKFNEHTHTHIYIYMYIYIYILINMKKRNTHYNDINGEHHNGLDKEGKNNTIFFSYIDVYLVDLKVN